MNEIGGFLKEWFSVIAAAAVAIAALPKAWPPINKTWVRVKKFFLSDLYSEITKLKQHIGLNGEEEKI